ncbi:helix-turn-helix domain-containing protein [Gordonia sp. JH63]|uniref:Helix-turn-helix domain-containing protein n=1 Tax=Gordonia hongkongensis TaxID=1701090 RepID=A0ABT6BZ06_9ACTN|nr:MULTISPECIES: helix-turn-helix domain-containing protein [Gordonia]MBR7191322.1 helix-turn-helix domain-containing protein [Gordonia sp. SCSIO 19800]MDF6102787.1 helix-turn-helix domain-containing protein [Gordonia hongkongensis]OCH83022.1 IclR family transcriptional regulator [Gordonia sp. UCD-TK1]QHD84711.1 helix-turn-helix domain-containing protein [Gordonia sp. JH63]
MTQTVGDFSDARQPARAASPPTARVVRIVELLADAEQPALTLAEIVRQTSMSRATAHAVVSELVDCGWLIRDPSAGTFGVGPAFVGLVRNADGADHLVRWAASAARDLCERFDVPCFVARRTSADAVTLASHAFPPHLAPETAQHPWLRNGSRIRLRPPICREFIAFDPDDARSNWIGQAAESTRTRLGMVLDVVAERGYSIERMTDDHVAMIEALSSLDTMSDTLRARVGDLLTELSVIDYLPEEIDACAADGTGVPVVTIGAPVFDSARRVVAAIVVCPNTTLDVDEVRRLGEATRAAADGISSHLS